MKNLMKLVFVFVLALVLTGCLPGKMSKKSVEDDQMMVIEEVSDDDSLETIEKELEETSLDDFEAEFDLIDEEIDQL